MKKNKKEVRRLGAITLDPWFSLISLYRQYRAKTIYRDYSHLITPELNKELIDDMYRGKIHQSLQSRGFDPSKYVDWFEQPKTSEYFGDVMSEIHHIYWKDLIDIYWEPTVEVKLDPEDPDYIKHVMDKVREVFYDGAI